MSDLSAATAPRLVPVDRSYTTSLVVDQTPEQAYAAVNNVRGWWTGDLVGNTDRLGEEFTYRYGEMHRSTQKITELVPGKKVVWLVTDSYLSFIQDKAEWTGTTIVFDIGKKGAKTEVRFTHVGLLAGNECYDACSNAWGSYITGSLRSLIETGKGEPNQ